MNSGFKKYLVGWAVLFVAFCLISFIIPVDRETGFWIGFVLITLAFIGQLVCAYYVFTIGDKVKFFYNFPIFMIAYTGLCVNAIVGVIFMALGDKIPSWIGAVICIVVLALQVVAVLKASGAAGLVDARDEAIREQTAFVKLFTVDTDNLFKSAATPEIQEECRKVYEAARYSDPMSTPQLTGLEQEITLKFGALKAAVAGGDLDRVKEASNEVIQAIGARNNMCKALKK